MSQANAIINVDINTSGAAASLRKLQTQINSFQSALNKNNVQQAASARDYSNQLSNLVNSSKFFSSETVRMRTSAGQLDETLSKGKGSVAQYFNSFRKGSAQAAQVMSLANARAAALQTQFVATGAAAGGYRESLAIRPLQAFNSAAAVSAEKLAIQRAMLTQASTHMINFGKNTQWAGRQLMVGFTVPLSIFGALAGKTFMELEKQAISFKKVYGDSFTTPEELEENMKAVSKLSVEYTKYGIAASKTMELAAQAAAMGAQGATLTDAITQSTKLATLGQMEQTKALETTIALQNAFGLSGEKLAKSVNFLNMVENQTVVTLQDLAEAIPRVAPVIKGLGGSVEDMAAMIAAMKEGGVSAAQGANALKSGLASLINPSNKASESLKEVGININQIVESNRGDLMGTVQDFGKALSSLDKLGQQQALEKVFGKYQYARLGALFTNIIKDGTQASKVLDMTTLSAQQLQATADRELKVITDSPATKFTAALEKLKVSIAPIGEMFVKFATPIVSFISKIADGFNNLPDFAKKFLALGTVLIGVVIPAGTMFLGLLMNLGGTLVKFTHIIGVALKGLTTGGLSGAVKAVSESLKYMSLAELDTSVASQQLAKSSQMVTSALLAQVPSATEATAAISALGREYATLAIRMQEASALGGVPFAVPGAAFNQAGRLSAQTPRVSRRLRRNKGGGIPYLNDGSNSTVPGMGNTDTVPAMLTPGEFVVNKKATSANLPLLHAINSRAPGFNSGGQIPGMQYFGFRNKQRFVQPMDSIDVPMESFFASARESIAKRIQVQSSTKSASLYDKLLAKYPEGTNSKVDAIRTAVSLGIPVESLNLKSRGNFAFRMSDKANQEMMLGKLTRNSLLDELKFEGAHIPLERQMKSYFGPTFTLDKDIFNRIYREEIAKLPENGINNARFEKASRNSLTRYMIETGVPRDQRKNFIRDILQQDSVSSNLSKTELLRTLDMQGIAYRESGKDVYATVDGKEIKLGHLLGREIADLGRPKGIRPFAGAGSNIESPAGYANVHANLGGFILKLFQAFRSRNLIRGIQTGRDSVSGIRSLAQIDTGTGTTRTVRSDRQIYEATGSNNAGVSRSRGYGDRGRLLEEAVTDGYMTQTELKEMTGGRTGRVIAHAISSSFINRFTGKEKFTTNGQSYPTAKIEDIPGALEDPQGSFRLNGTSEKSFIKEAQNLAQILPSSGASVPLAFNNEIARGRGTIKSLGDLGPQHMVFLIEALRKRNISGEDGRKITSRAAELLKENLTKFDERIDESIWAQQVKIAEDQAIKENLNKFPKEKIGRNQGGMIPMLNGGGIASGIQHLMAGARVKAKAPTKLPTEPPSESTHSWEASGSDPAWDLSPAVSYFLRKNVKPIKSSSAEIKFLKKRGIDTNAMEMEGLADRWNPKNGTAKDILDTQYELNMEEGVPLITQALQRGATNDEMVASILAAQSWHTYPQEELSKVVSRLSSSQLYDLSRGLATLPENHQLRSLIDGMLPEVKALMREASTAYSDPELGKAFFALASMKNQGGMIPGAFLNGGMVSGNVVKWLKGMMVGGSAKREVLRKQVPINIEEALSTATRRVPISRGSIDPINSLGDLRDFSHWSTYGGVGRFMDDSELGTQMRTARWRKSMHESDIKKARKSLAYLKANPDRGRSGQVEELEQQLRWGLEGEEKQQAIIDDLMAEFVPTLYRTNIKEEQRYFNVSGTVPRDEQVLNTLGASKQPLNEGEIAMMGARMSGNPTIRDVGEAEARARFHAAQKRIKDINRSISSGGVDRNGVNGLLRHLSEEAENMAAFANWGRGREVIYPGIVGKYNVGGNVFKSGPSNKIVPGVGNTDIVPAMLTPGEFVINKKATSANMQLLRAINNGTLRGYEEGEVVAHPLTGKYTIDNGDGSFDGQYDTKDEAERAGRARPRPGGPAGRARPRPGMGRGMGISMGLGTIGGAMMMAPMIPGIGENAGLSNALSIGGTALSTASIIPMLAPMLSGLGAIAIPAAIVAGALGAVGASLYIWRKNVDDSARASAELGANLGTTANSLNTMAKLLGTQTPAQRSMQLQMGVSKNEQEILQSPEMQGMLSSEEGQKFITDLKDVTSAERFAKLSDYLKSAIASGMLDKTQASVFAKAVGMQLGDAVLATSVSSSIRNQKTGSGALLDMANKRQDAQVALGDAPGADQSSKVIGGAIQVIQDFSNAEALAREEFTNGKINFEEMKKVVDASRDAQEKYTTAIQDAMIKTSDFGGTMQATKDQMLKSGAINEDQFNAITAAATTVATKPAVGSMGGRGYNTPVLNKELEALMVSAIATGMSPDNAIKIGEEISKKTGVSSGAYESAIKDGLSQTVAFEKAGVADQLYGKEGIIKGSFRERGFATGLLNNFTKEGGKPTELVSYLGGISEPNRNKTVNYMTKLDQKQKQTMISDSQNLSQSISQPLVEKLQMSDAYKKGLESNDTQGINEAISRASKAGVSEKILTYAINTYANGDKTDPTKLKNGIDQLTIASESLNGLPDEIIKGLKIDTNDPKDLEKFGPMVQTLQKNWKIIENLNPNIDLIASMEYLTMENGKKISITESSNRVQKLNKAFKNLGSGKASIRKQAEIDIAVAYAGDVAEPEVAADKAIDELHKQFKNFDNFDPIIKEQMIKIKMDYDIENLNLGISIEEAMNALNGAKEPLDRLEILKHIARLKGQLAVSEMEENARLGAIEKGSGGGGGGGGGGEKSIPQQLKEQAKTSQEMFNKITQLKDTAGYKSFIAGPFAPEFLEYLRSQGAAGLKVIKQGLSKVREAYANYQKSKISEGAAMAALTPATLIQESKKVALSSQYNQKLAGKGMSAEEIDAVRQYVSDEDLLYKKELKKKVKNKTATPSEKKQLKRYEREQKRTERDAPLISQAQKTAESITDMTTETSLLNAQLGFINDGKTPELAAAMAAAGLKAGDLTEKVEKYTKAYNDLKAAEYALDPGKLDQEKRDNLMEIADINRQIDEINLIKPLEDQVEVQQKIIDGQEKIVRGKQQEIDVIGRGIELKQRELEPLDNQIEKLQELSDKTSEAYDNQIEALDKIYEREAQIDKLKQGQLNVAQALSRGDVAGAAQAAMAASQDIAERSRQEARSALESQKEVATQNIQNQILEIEKQKKAINKEIEDLQMKQRVIQDDIYRIQSTLILPAENEIYKLQGEINIAADLLAGKYNNAADAMKNLVYQLRLANDEKARLDGIPQPSPNTEPTPADQVPPAPPAASGTVGVPPTTSTKRVTAQAAAAAAAASAHKAVAAAHKAVVAAAHKKEEQKTTAINKRKTFGGLMSYNIGGMMEGYNTGGNIGYRGSKEPPPVMMNYGGAIKKYIHGSIVPGRGMSDKVPAMLTPGEFIIRKSVSETYGPMLSALNSQVFPKMNLNSSIPTLGNKDDDGSVYNYQISVSLNGSNLDPNDVANAVMQKIKMSENKGVRSNNIRG